VHRERHLLALTKRARRLGMKLVPVDTEEAA
jgi:hypothetical protein